MPSKKKPIVEEKIADNQLALPTGKIITFNDEQYEGIKKIREWLKNGDKNNYTFTLAGYAGSGKTTCIKKILDDYRYSVVVSAPTHKAKKVIIETTDVEGKTLHSLLGLRPDVDLDNFNPNYPQFEPIAEPTIMEYDLVIIDEASMINEDLYNMIHKTLEGYNTKVLFMGDPAQIPPVGEKESVVFNEITNEFHQLTKIERQHDSNPLSLVYGALRDNLHSSSGGLIKETVMNEKGEGILFTDDRTEFKDLILRQYRTNDFKNDLNYAKVIAWKNSTVMGANKSIRNALFGEDSDVIEIGDVLMGYRIIRSSNSRYNIIENSEDYRVVSKKDKQINYYGISGWDVKLREDMPHGRRKHKNVFIVDVNDSDNLHNYAELHDRYKEIGLKKKVIGSWSEYYTFRRKNIILKTITKFRDGSPRNKKEKIVKDMDYGMAITAHKSQGSTYTHVFIMEYDMDENWSVKERNQLKYTSFTRPTTSAVVLINS